MCAKSTHVRLCDHRKFTHYTFDDYSDLSKLGGDGTVLYASWLFQRVVPPVLSLALGSLGFLTKFDYQSFRETLTDVFQEGVTVSLRLRFEGTVMRSQKRKTDSTQDLVDELIGGQSEENQTHQPDECYEILNEIVVDRGPNPSKLVTCLFCGGSIR